MDGGDVSSDQRVIRSKSYQVQFDDTAGQEKLIIGDAKGNEIATFDTQGVSIKSPGRLELVAQGVVTIEGTSVEIKGQPIHLNK